MRKILFRGKRVDNSEWVYGCLLNNTYGASKPVIISDSSYTDNNRIVNDDWEFVIPETVGQYTGLKDRNGINIFEGDVVTAPYIDPIFHSVWNEGNLTENAVVKYADGMFYIEYVESKQKITLFGLLSGAKEAEVIGNIYDNLELLKE